MTAPKPRWIASSPPRIPIARPCRRSRTSARAWIRSSSLRRIERKLQHIYSLAHRGPVRAARHPSRTTGSKSDVDPCRRPSRRPGHRNNDKTMPLSGNTYLWLDRGPAHAPWTGTEEPAVASLTLSPARPLSPQRGDPGYRHPLPRTGEVRVRSGAPSRWPGRAGRSGGRPRRRPPRQ